MANTWVFSFAAGLVFSTLIAINDAKLPADIKPCKAGDEECMVKTINQVIERKYTGDPELGLVSIDPLKIDKMEAKSPKGSPISLELTFRNGNVFGYKHFRAYKVRGFGKSPGGKHQIYLNGPYAALVSDSNIDGKILVLPVKGRGASNVTLENVYFTVNINAKPKIQNDLTYLDIQNVKLNLNATRMYLEFEDFFGDKALTENINKFMNENWHDIYIELRPAVLKAFGDVFTTFLTKLFATHPYRDFVEGGD